MADRVTPAMARPVSAADRSIRRSAKPGRRQFPWRNMRCRSHWRESLHYFPSALWNHSPQRFSKIAINSERSKPGKSPVKRPCAPWRSEDESLRRVRLLPASRQERSDLILEAEAYDGPSLIISSPLVSKSANTSIETPAPPTRGEMDCTIFLYSSSSSRELNFWPDETSVRISGFFAMRVGLVVWPST